MAGFSLRSLRLSLLPATSGQILQASDIHRRYNQLVRRLCTVAALAGILLATPLWGQMRGGRGFGSGGHFGGFPARGFRGPGRGPFFGGGFGHQPGFFFNRSPFFGHRRGFFFGATFASPFYYPYDYGYPYPYPVVVETPPPPAYYPDQYYEQGDLRRDIDVLTGKVDKLQNDVETRMPAPRPRARQEDGPRPTTWLVFRDQHTREVQNYAIVGQTLWVFDEQQAERIPLSDLDLDGTHRFNDQRGIDFQLPQ